MMWTIPTSLLNTSTYTTVSLNILSQGLPVSGLGNGNYFDISAVTSFVVAADYGMSNGQQNLTFNADIDDIWVSGATNSQLAATGSVSLGSATLAPTVAAGYTPTVGSQFTIVDKAPAGAVTGTFNGLAEGATLTINTHSYTISYVGNGPSGGGNDVVLTRVNDAAADTFAPVFDLNGAAGGTAYTTSWSNAGAVNVTAADATVTDADTTNLTQLKVALASPHAGDTLAANNATHPAIAWSFGGNTLTLSGSASQSDYTDILRTITYNNTSPPVGVGQVVLNFTASDGTLTSTTETTTINVADVVDLNGAAGGTGFSNTYDGVTPANVADSANATVNGPGAANLTQMTVAISGTHTGDLLAANNTAEPLIAVAFASGTLTLSGSDTVANYQAVLRTVKYSNTVGPGVDTITINVQGKDATNVLTNTATSTITLPPIVDLNGGTTGTSSTSGWFNSGKVGLEGVDSGDATATAPAGLNLTSMTVVESAFHAGDVLAMTPITGITGLTPVFSAGTLSITGSQTAANYQKILRLISYDNTSGGPGVSSFTANVTASDGTLTSTAVTATINSTVLSGQVLGNRLFYNNSKYDNNGTAIDGGQRCLGDRTRQDRLQRQRLGGLQQRVELLQGDHRRDGRSAKRHRLARQHHAVGHHDAGFAGLGDAGHLQQRGYLVDGPHAVGLLGDLGWWHGWLGSDRDHLEHQRHPQPLAGSQRGGPASRPYRLDSADVFFFGNNVGDSGLGNTSSP